MQGQSPYSASKIAADKVAESYYKSFDLPVVTIRPFNTYGTRQSARAFIPTVIIQALTQKEVRMGSLEPIRDMTFVKDTAEGFIKVGLCDKVIGKVVNLGTGEGQTIGKMVETILGLLGDKIPVKQDSARIRPAKSEVMRLISNNTIAKEVCGWKPKYNLEAGLKETIDWLKKNLSLYRPEIYSV